MEDTALVLPVSMAFMGTPGPADEASQTISLSMVASTSDAGGSIAFDGGVVVYVPPSDFAGLADPLTAMATVRVTVVDTNEAPVATDDDVMGREDTEGVFPASFSQTTRPGRCSRRSSGRWCRCRLRASRVPPSRVQQ